jgi:hypothetical protein
MNLITFSEPMTIAFRKSSGGTHHTFEAGREYLIANAQLERIIKDENVQKRIYKCSRGEMRFRNFVVTPQRRTPAERVLIFNGSGGYGDQIMTWPVARILAQWYDVHVLTDPGNTVCWWNLPFVKTVNTIPIAWEQVKLFEHFAHWEAVVNMDEHHDQGHPIDMMLHRIGINPDSVPAENKVVNPAFTPSEVGATKRLMQTGRKLGMYQLSSANTIRCLPANDSVFLALKLAEAFPDTHWVCLWDEFIKPEYKTLLETAIKERNLLNIEAFCSPNLREVWALTQFASVVVAPDSMMVHVAGCMNVPCVGLWGPVSPDRRVKYYKNHLPIHHKEYCVHSPCFWYAATFPKYCPPRPGERTVCDVLSGISHTEVVDAVKQIRK